MKPTLEALEERNLLASAVYGGGPVVPHPQVSALYVGQQPQANTNALLSYLASGPFTTMLSPYGIGGGKFVQAASAPLIGTGITDQAIQTDLLAAIQQGVLPGPDSNQVYVVFLAPGVRLTGPGFPPNNEILGYHDSFTLRGTPIYYAVVPYPGGVNPVQSGLSVWQSLTQAVSHEFAETVTDPIPGTGWTFPSGAEIGDVANGIYFYSGGYLLQAEAAPDGQPLVGPGLTLATAETNLMYDGAVYLDLVAAAGGNPLYTPYLDGFLQEVAQSPIWNTTLGTLYFEYGEYLGYVNLQNQQ